MRGAGDTYFSGHALSPWRAYRPVITAVIVILVEIYRRAMVRSQDWELMSDELFVLLSLG